MEAQEAGLPIPVTCYLLQKGMVNDATMHWRAIWLSRPQSE